MLRWLLGRAAEHAGLSRWARRSPLARHAAHRFIAGETLEEALAVATELARGGRSLTVDHVGEFVASLDDAEAAAAVYLEVLDVVRRDRLPAGISVKPTQLGSLLDEERCAGLVTRLAKAAGDAGTDVTLDMEDHTVTERTVRLVERAQADGHRNVGCAVQSALHRTPEDVRRVTRAGAHVRLCKGAYAEPAHLAWQRRVEVDRAYLEAARYLLRESDDPRFATHDHRLIAAVKREAAVLGRARDTYEFQLLHGVRPELQRSLVDDGYRVRVYVPFGRRWFPYFTRRLAERPANLAFFLRALAGGPS